MDYDVRIEAEKLAREVRLIGDEDLAPYLQMALQQAFTQGIMALTLNLKR